VKEIKGKWMVVRGSGGGGGRGLLCALPRRWRLGRAPPPPCRPAPSRPWRVQAAHDTRLTHRQQQQQHQHNHHHHHLYTRVVYTQKCLISTPTLCSVLVRRRRRINAFNVHPRRCVSKASAALQVRPRGFSVKHTRGPKN